MSRIDLRGVIVPSEYDASWAAGYIDKGIIIPESRFRSMLAAASKSEPLTVYVNSPGGSVFSAGEMVNAVREWKAETKQPVTVILGALTASAASAFSIMVADTIKAHANAKMMFHGAWTVSIGGKEMHQDTAELLGKINGDIKARLVSKYGMSPELVTEWFSEGREGWLSAQELLDSKMVSEIIRDPSDELQFLREEMEEIETHGLGIAALLKTNTEGGEANNNDGQTDPDNKSGGGDDGAAGDGNQANAGTPGDAGKPNFDASQTGPAAGNEAIAEAFAAGEVQGIEKGHADCADVIKALRDKLASAEETGRKLQSERDQIRVVSERTREALQKANDHVARLLNGGMTFSASIETWEQAMADCDGDYEAARRKYPEAYRTQRANDKANRK